MSTTVKSRGLVLSADMAHAAWAGRKTQMRIPLNPQPHRDADSVECDPSDHHWFDWHEKSERCLGGSWKSRYGIGGDLLWVREPWQDIGDERRIEYVYKADEKPRGPRWKYRPAGTMPFDACRTRLEIVGVVVERLHDIGKDGRRAVNVLAEGIDATSIERLREWFHPDDCPALAFGSVWDEKYGRGAFRANPWVMRYTFKLKA